MLIHDVQEYVHWNLPYPEFYIQNLLAKRGSMLLYGAPGVKKSWLAEYLGFCIATGNEWLGFQTEQARVLLCNFEISPIAFAVLRLRPMERVFTLQPQMLYEYSPNVTLLENRQSFERFAEEVRPIQPKVIILDCLQGCYGGDESDMEKASVWINNVKELQQEHEAAIIVVHHSNKNQLAVGMNRSRGTSRFVSWVDTVVFMAQQPSGIQLQFEKYRLSTRPEIYNINIQFQNYLWTIRGGERNERTGTE